MIPNARTIGQKDGLAYEYHQGCSSAAQVESACYHCDHIFARNHLVASLQAQYQSCTLEEVKELSTLMYEHPMDPVELFRLFLETRIH